jgi:hypothetical protein
MKSHLLFALLISSTAFATNHPPPKPVGTEATAVASAESVVVSSVASVTAVDVANSQQQDQSQSASADNAGNTQTINSSYKGVRNAPSVALGAVYPTASCQGGVGLGGSGVNGSGLLNFSFTKKECETVVLAQNFAALGMPDVSCEILKTTKAWKRAVVNNPELAAHCEQPEPASQAQAAVASPPDMSSYVKRDELQERDARMLRTMSKK